MTGTRSRVAFREGMALADFNQIDPTWLPSLHSKVTFSALDVSSLQASRCYSDVSFG